MTTARTPVRTFRVHSMETGHSFGEWEATDGRDAIRQFVEQARSTGAEAEAGLVHAVEITPLSLAAAYGPE